MNKKVELDFHLKKTIEIMDSIECKTIDECKICPLFYDECCNRYSWKNEILEIINSISK